jgi:CRISPR-associated protein Cas2
LTPSTVAPVTYDVCDPKRLRKVFRAMKGFGSHLQLSVFQCDLTPRDLVDMTYTLGGLIDQKSDQVLIMDLGPSEGKPIKSIQYVGKPMTVVQRGAMIV